MMKLEELLMRWIEPEISQRRKDGSLPENFMLHRCLIRLPKNRSPIVEFNDEIEWRVEIKLAPGISKEKGQIIFLHEVQGVEYALHPEVDEQRVAFVYLFWDGRSYQAIFDFTPNSPDELISKYGKKNSLGKMIAEDIQAITRERAVLFYDTMQTQLQEIGLWAVPILLPYPLTQIIKQVADGNIEDARATLIGHCTPEYIESLSSRWWSIRQFEERRNLIQDALHAHKEGRYRLSIPALLPHIEGIVTDWIYTKLPENQIPWRPESKTKKFRDLAFDESLVTYTYTRIIESATEFILNGPVLETFKRWFDAIDTAFPNRHAIGHGKYDEALYSEENSIKLFLLLDTIYYVISTSTQGENNTTI